MLNELDALSQQISRLILLNRQYRQTQYDLTQQLTHMRTKLNEIQSTLEQTRAERDALCAECTSLTANINEAHACLHALLEKLPQPSALHAAPFAQAAEDTQGEHR